MDWLVEFLRSPLAEFALALLLIVYGTQRFTARRKNATLVAASSLFAIGFFRYLPENYHWVARLWWTVLLWSAGSLVMYRLLWAADQAAITVSPCVLEKIQSPLGVVKRPIFVMNNTERVLFSVWIKVSSDPIVAPTDIKVEVDEPTHVPVEILAKGWRLSGDYLGFFGLDVEQRPSVVIRFHEIRPKSQRRVTVWAEKPCVLVCKVWSFDEQPAPVVESRDEASVAFRMPEAFTSHGFIVPAPAQPRPETRGRLA